MLLLFARMRKQLDKHRSVGRFYLVQEYEAAIGYQSHYEYYLPEG